jgi:hypothetical protein
LGRGGLSSWYRLGQNRYKRFIVQKRTTPDGSS